MLVRAALDQAVERELVTRNVAHGARARRRQPTNAPARAWTADELRTFLAAAGGHRLYPALHLAAHTGMRRGEIVGLKWSDLHWPLARLSLSRALQNVGGRPVEFGVKPAPAAGPWTWTAERSASSTGGAGVSAAVACPWCRRLDVPQPDRPVSEPRIAHPGLRPCCPTVRRTEDPPS